MDCSRSDGSASPRELADGEVLMLCDRRFPLDFERDGLAVGGRQVRVRETPNSGEGTAHSVWDGAVILGKYLEHCFGREALSGACVAELGAGTGLAGCCAAALGASPVVLTDLPYAIPALRFAADAANSWHADGCSEGGARADRSAPHPDAGSRADTHAAATAQASPAAAAAEPADARKAALHESCGAATGPAGRGGSPVEPTREKGAAVAVCVADWNEPSDAAAAIVAAAGDAAPDVILLADVVWVEELVEPLVAALERLAESEGAAASHRGRGVAARCDGLSDATCRGPLVVAAHQTRSQATDDVFWAALGRRFEWRRVGDISGVPREFAPEGPLFLVEARLRIA